MGYWNSKVVPRFKKIFEKNSAKKAAAAEACKTFDESKETINKEIEEKKTELQPKVVETYEATSAEVKALVRDPKEAGLKKNSAAVLKYLEALVGIEFPGSTAVKEAASSFGAGYVAGPVTFIFEKVCVFLPEEVKTREVPVEEVKAEEPAKTEEPVKTEETSGEKEKEIVEETKKEETVATAVVEEKKPEVEKEEEKKPVVEEVKKEEAAPAPAVVETPVTAPETTTPAPVAEPPKP
ncbi:PREDICTED: plasma membrane-associated cation-binding protein 1 [Brassica oleracea var. oleracea]|uniref:plasma membrane-associated cation-binding protein 1 n=1 Tax=Brassica oleracea var. oleracea TaxID=109376 RepID=UPI0003E6BDB8|nr:PREDICTED: plasma membrane-associated cation-binding protein 1 [Brassica oleracea var. oleracea]XP_013602983.1 PREDICTED: plasma membrane-associated cation-binding protein 1 [Brassica oleracea var. oleracea]